ncbi:unnamed protein product [Darwinula stevensoni]|uniref:Calx-beta domain-containing protein n=1 Tax=Darwinula stevensoni TaxID=69355 RepID=A0A7R8XDD3_9CRUS|nr:unnamed protein product [Darwinula stevensoni]CAG0888558.1 unnamed protein product [Darwinula stevensoni]
MKGILVLVLVACLQVTATSAEEDDNSTTCQDGLLIPIWTPFENLSTGDRVARAIIYFLSLSYLFIGVSIIADRFMASIEVITSQEKEVTVKRANGEKQIIVVRVWNETVANLTLMALGSSAPEILLSIIEVYAKNFEAGELGPGTIVGSAAFNLFIIIAICVHVIPSNETRKIKHLRVFFITATWSVFAYIWLYLILTWSSHGVVEVWEGLVTFLFFPATVVSAYIADRRLLIYKYLSKDYRLNRRGVVVEHEASDLEMAKEANHVEFKHFEEEYTDENIRQFEEHRREFISILKELRQKHPNEGMESLEAMAREEVLNRGPKSRAYYRIQATRKLTGGGNLMRKAHEKAQIDAVGTKQEREDKEFEEEDRRVAKIFFDPGHYTVMENVGTFQATIAREGGDPNLTILVDYRTEDGTANAGSDYDYTEGTLIFRPGEKRKSISLTVIDDDVFEEDEHFYIRLSNLRVTGPDGQLLNGFNWNTGRGTVPAQLTAPALATVMILDDDHCGIFNLAEKDVEIVESVGTYRLKVLRWSGARGHVSVPYKTIEGTAKPGKDYEHISGELIFEDNETE